VVDHVGQFRLHDAIYGIWGRVRQVNQAIDTVRPWELLKAGNQQKLHVHLRGWVEDIQSIAYNLKPFLPDTSQRIEEIFSQERIQQGETLFPRL
jgi:methionyl-tRNA synthetase